VTSALIDVRNNIFDGSIVLIKGILAANVTEGYNDIGGAQGNAAYSAEGSATEPSSNMINVNPLYVNASATPPDFHLSAGSSLIYAGEPGLTTNNDIGAY